MSVCYVKHGRIRRISISRECFLIALVRVRRSTGFSIEIPKVPHSMGDQEGVSLFAAQFYCFLVQCPSSLILTQVANEVSQSLESADQPDP